MDWQPFTEALPTILATVVGAVVALAGTVWSMHRQTSLQEKGYRRSVYADFLASARHLSITLEIIQNYKEEPFSSPRSGLKQATDPEGGTELGWQEAERLMSYNEDLERLMKDIKVNAQAVALVASAPIVSACWILVHSLESRLAEIAQEVFPPREEDSVTAALRVAASDVFLHMARSDLSERPAFLQSWRQRRRVRKLELIAATLERDEATSLEDCT